MHHQRSIPTRATMRRRYGALLGCAAVTLALAGATTASAAPDGSPKERAHARDGSGPPPGAAKGSLRERFGGGKHDGKPGDEGKKLGHHSAQAGAPAVDGHHHGGHERMKQRLDELTKKEAAGTLTDDEKKELERLKKIHQHRLTRDARKARLAELKEKENAGKLTPDEKSELERIQQVQSRHEAMEKLQKAREENRKQRARDAKRSALKEFPKLAQDAAATAEYRKYAERLAKLERAKELATADQNADVAARIDKLIASENQRHQAWLTKHQPAARGANQGANQ